MDFQKKLKIRVCIALFCGAIGVLCMVSGFLKESSPLSAFGLMFLVIAVARIRQYKRITKTEESLKKREIAETDERNVMLWTKARGLAFSVFIILAAIAIVVLMLTGQNAYATFLSYVLLSFMAIYWVCYFVISRKYK